MGKVKGTMTTTVVFDHRGRTSKGRPGPLEVRVTVQSRVYYVGAGVKVLRSEWRAGEVVNRPDADLLNERLDIIRKAVAEEVNDRLIRDVPIDVAEIKRAVWGNRSDEDGGTLNVSPFLDWFEERVQLLGLAPGTLKHYNTTLAHLRACGYIRTWRQLTPENVRKFDLYLHGLRIKNAVTRANGKGVALTQGTIHNQHKNLKAMINRAVVEGRCQSNPYDRLRGEFARGERETVEYLTKDELGRIEALELDDGGMMSLARDLFVFQSYTGMGYSDMQSFSLSDCIENDGRWIVAKQRQKTGATYYVQLLPPALAIVKKYGGAMPQVVGQVYNRNLKAIAAMAGIHKRVTSHVARHTFATWALHEEVPIERVAKMLGHTNIRQTQRYAKVLAEDVYKEFDRMAKSLTNKTTKKQTT